MKPNNKSSKGTKQNYHVGHRERMRQRFDADREMMTFQEHEMLEFLLNTVIPRKDTNEIAHELINKSGSLYGVFNESIEDLMKVKNMTVSAAYLLAGLVPIMRKSLRLANDMSMKQIVNYGDAADFFHTFFLGRNTECLCILYMNVNFKIIKTEICDELNPTSVNLNVRKVAASAVKCGAVYIMIGHNHPSGSPIPSENDLYLVWDLFNALANLEVRILDNFIFTNDGFLSFQNVGILDKFVREYCRKNPNKTLKENNVHTSLYLSNLSQYLVDVSKLKEENLVELITVQEFIDRNKLKINDFRVPKQGIDGNVRKPINEENFKFAKNSDSADLPISADDADEGMELIAKRVRRQDYSVSNRAKLVTVNLDEMFSREAVVENRAQKYGNGLMADQEELWAAAIEITNERRKAKGATDEDIQKGMEDINRISASTRNIPKYIDIEEKNE